MDPNQAWEIAGTVVGIIAILLVFGLPWLSSRTDDNPGDAVGSVQVSETDSNDEDDTDNDLDTFTLAGHSFIQIEDTPDDAECKKCGAAIRNYDYGNQPIYVPYCPAAPPKSAGPPIPGGPEGFARKAVLVQRFLCTGPHFRAASRNRIEWNSVSRDPGLMSPW